MSGTIGKSLRYVKDSINLFGIGDGLRYSYHFFRSHFLHKLGGYQKRSLIRYYPRNLGNTLLEEKVRYPLYFRPDTSDVRLIANILVGIREYDIELDSSRFDSVLDLGANVGLFTILYSARYPDKKYLAVEPERQNFEILSKNVAEIETANVEHAGVWYRSSPLKIVDHGNHWGFTVEETDENDNQADCFGIDIDTLCEKYDLRGNLLIKMDIEGSEFPIFKHIDSQRWLDRTYALMIEFHDKGEERKQIYDIMEEKGYIYFESRENIVFVKK